MVVIHRGINLWIYITDTILVYVYVIRLGVSRDWFQVIVLLIRSRRWNSCNFPHVSFIFIDPIWLRLLLLNLTSYCNLFICGRYTIQISVHLNCHSLRTYWSIVIKCRTSILIYHSLAIIWRWIYLQSCFSFNEIILNMIFILILFLSSWWLSRRSIATFSHILIVVLH